MANDEEHHHFITRAEFNNWREKLERVLLEIHDMPQRVADQIDRKRRESRKQFLKDLASIVTGVAAILGSVVYVYSLVHHGH